jgi:hypothetical protein
MLGNPVWIKRLQIPDLLFVGLWLTAILFQRAYRRRQLNTHRFRLWRDKLRGRRSGALRCDC